MITVWWNPIFIFLKDLIELLIYDDIHDSFAKINILKIW